MSSKLIRQATILAQQNLGPTCEVEVYSRDEKTWGARTTRPNDRGVLGVTIANDFDSKPEFATTELALLDLERQIHERVAAHDAWRAR